MLLRELLSIHLNVKSGLNSTDVIYIFVSAINCFSLQRIDIHPAFIFEPLFIDISIHMSQGMDEYGLPVID